MSLLASSWFRISSAVGVPLLAFVRATRPDPPIRRCIQLGVMSDTRWTDHPEGANTAATGIIHGMPVPGCRYRSGPGRLSRTFIRFAHIANASDNGVGWLPEQNEEAR